MPKSIRVQRYLTAKTPPEQILEAVASFGELALLMHGHKTTERFGVLPLEFYSPTELVKWATAVNWKYGSPVEVVVKAERLLTQVTQVVRGADGSEAHLRLFVRWTGNGVFLPTEPVVLQADGAIPQDFGRDHLLRWLQGGWFPHGPSGVDKSNGTVPVEIACARAFAVG